jgi:hypothetical protein
MVASQYSTALEERGHFFRGLRRRVVATVGLLVGGLVWVILYLGFLAGHFAWYQNLAVVLVSFLVIPAVVVAMWISWGMAMGRHFHHEFWDDEFP